MEYPRKSRPATLARIIWNATEYLLYIYICLANGRGAERERKKFQILPATAESWNLPALLVDKAVWAISGGNRKLLACKWHASGGVPLPIFQFLFYFPIFRVVGLLHSLLRRSITGPVSFFFSPLPPLSMTLCLLVNAVWLSDGNGEMPCMIPGRHLVVPRGPKPWL